jgi:hypothetical protein
MSLENDLTLKLKEEGLLDKDGTPISSNVEYISGGSELYRYLGLANLLQDINTSSGSFLVCTPFSYQLQDIRLRWSGRELQKTTVFDQKLIECIQSPSRFIVITLSLRGGRSAHANYILIDKGININESSVFTAIRLEPHGFCNTSEQYRPIELDATLKEYLRQISNGKIQLIDNDDVLTVHGLQKYEIAYRADSCQLIPNQGLCATHSFLILDLFFKFVNKKIPINFFWLKEGGHKDYVDISGKEGLQLYSAIFTAVNMAIIYPKDKSWIESTAVALNQQITELNNILLIQLAELLSVSRSRTRLGTPADRIITNILGTSSRIPAGTCTETWHDAVFIALFEYIIKNINLSKQQLNELFTIYGINYRAIETFATSFPTSLPGGRKTRRRKSKKGKKRRKTKRKRKSYKH